jgi:hypothetical protein
MADYKKSEQLFKDLEIHNFFKKPQGQLDDELFYQRITNPETDKPYQWADLDSSYRKHGNNITYPLRQINQIVRIRRLDGTEWLKTRGRIVGLDKAGNEVEHSFTDSEIYYEPVVEYGFKPKDTDKPDGPKVRVAIGAGINETDLIHKKYTLPFSQKNFDMLYKQRPSQSPTSVSLVIIDEGSSEAPRQIVSMEKFRNTPFEDLFVEATTPKLKLDRSYKDNLETSHIR